MNNDSLVEYLRALIQVNLETLMEKRYDELKDDDRLAAHVRIRSAAYKLGEIKYKIKVLVEPMPEEIKI